MIIELLLFLILIVHNEKEPTVAYEQEDIQQERVLECVHEIMSVTAETPLRGYEKDICEKSRDTGIDYHLVLRIGILESGLQGGCWGDKWNIWCIRVEHGVYNSPSDSIIGIFDLMERYKERGLETIEDIGRVYCPPCGDEYINDYYYLSRTKI